MSSPKRLEILNILAKEEVDVSSLTKITGMRKSNVSQHLSLLKDLKLVVTRKQGKHSYYKISDPLLVEPCKILNRLWKRNHFSY